MPEAPYALALGAGLLAAVNPCGFALLPAYVSLVVAGAGDGGRAAALRRALATTLAMTGGFVAVFGLFGLVVTPLALSVERYLPWVTVVIGAGLVGLGGWLLSGREVYLRLPKPGGGPAVGSVRAMAGYGASYAVASLSCTIGPFLALTTATFRSSSLLGGLGVFVAYAAGMGLVVGVVTVATALARQALVVRLRRVLPHVNRAGGALLVLAGLYVAYYGWFELRVFGGAAADDPVVSAATSVQGAVQRWLAGVGAGRIALAGLVLVAALAAVAAVTARAGGRDRSAPGASPRPRTAPPDAPPPDAPVPSTPAAGRPTPAGPVPD